jgi:hypothetical protein
MQRTVMTHSTRIIHELFPLSAVEAETQPVDERSSLAGDAIHLDPPSLLSMWNDQGRSAGAVGDFRSFRATQHRRASAEAGLSSRRFTRRLREATG